MKIKLIVIGKTDEKYLKEGIEKYIIRLKHYTKFQVVELKDVNVGKKANIVLQKEIEGKAILEKVEKNEKLILLDENGSQYSSVKFSNYLQKRMNASEDITFVIGGPFGFSDEIYARANDKLSLSKMTFSHQMVRLFFIEQIYRGFTILNSEKYHHQ